MKKGFQDYTGKDLWNIKLKPKDEDIIKKFLKDVEGSAGSKRTKNIHRIMIQVCDITQAPLDKWDYDTLSSFLSILNKSDKANHTKNDIKKALKRFLKFYYEDWEKRFKKLKFESIKQKKAVNKERIGKDKLLSPSEFELLVNACDRFLYKALFSLAYESAGRPEELFKLKWSDLNLDKKEVRLVSSKTGNTRFIPLNDCLVHLQNHKNNYPYPDVKKEDYIFPSPNDRNKPLISQTAHSYLRTIGRKSIKRDNLFLYLFRHTRLNFLRKKLSPDAYEMFSDHSLAVGMEFYSHNDQDDLNEEMYSNVFKKEILNKADKSEIKKLERENKEIRLRLKKIEDFEKRMEEKMKMFKAPQLIKSKTWSSKK